MVQALAETTPRAPTEGHLAIRLGVEDGVVSHVTVDSTRRIGVAGWLAGRGHEEVVRAVERLFPACAMAHRVACARAMEHARGHGRHERVEAMRETVLLAEAAASHVWQLALAWPKASSAPMDTARVREARSLAQHIRDSLFGPRTAGHGPPAPETAPVRRAAERLATLLRELAARSDDPLLAAVIAAERADFGGVPGAPPTRLDPRRVGERLASRPGFAACPELEGPIDVSAYGRLSSAPAVRQVAERFGHGLLARLVARRVDAQELADRLSTSLVGALPASAPEDPPAGRRGEGTGWAMTARGPLHYWVRVGEHTVEDLRVVAPTDWTFHPRGVLRDALVGRRPTSTLRRDAHWLVLALDPCVPWTVEVHGA